MTRWDDATPYSQGDKIRTPRTWELTAHPLRVVVTRHVDYPPDVWLVRLYPLHREWSLPPGLTAEQAQAQAITLATTVLKDALSALEQVAS